MRRRLLTAVLLVIALGAVASYVAWRRDTQYRTFIAMGDRAMAVHDTFGAIEAFSGAMALRPSSMLAWLKRGEVYLKRQDYRSALRDLRTAVGLDPAALRPLELLGDTHTALERYDWAADQYEAYLRVDDRDPRVYYKLALARLYDRRLDAAIAALRRSLRLDDTAPEAHYLLGVCLAQQRRSAEAIRALERAVRLSPAMIEARKALADQYRKTGRTADQVRQLEAVAALDPGRRAHQIAIANAWAHAGRVELAVATLVRALERDPDAPELLVGLGRVWLGVAESHGDRGALGKALEALRRAVVQMPSGSAFSALGHAQLLAGDLPGAVRSLQQATATLPVDPRAFGDLSIAAERLQRWSLAHEALVRQVALSGEDTPARLRAERAARLARLSERLGKEAAITRRNHVSSPSRVISFAKP
jgi:tetratricopeptide (TPR) repeat protein